MSHSVLIFHHTTFNVVDRNGAPWLRSAEIASALGYADDAAIGRLFLRNSDEFTEAMTLTVNLTVKGFGNGSSEKEVRIFSLRGAHLLAMFARTEIAKQFRVWVLDLLDREAARNHLGIGTPTISPLQKQTLKKIVDTRVAELVQDQPAMLRKISTASLYQTAWRKFHHRFTINEYAALPSSRFEEAKMYLNTVKLAMPDVIVADGASPSLFTKKYREQALTAIHHYANACKEYVEKGAEELPKWPALEQNVIDGFMLDAIQSARFEVKFDSNMQLCLTAIPENAVLVSLKNKEAIEALMKTGIPKEFLPDIMRIAIGRLTPSFPLLPK